MKYNTLPNGACTVNTDLGNRGISHTELVDLITSNKAGNIVYEEVITYYNDYTWSPNDKVPGLTLSNNDLTAEHISADITQQKIRHIQGKTTGKYYFEVKVDSESNGLMIGVGTSTSSLSENVASIGVAYNYDGLIYKGSEHTSYGDSWANGDIIGVAFDLSNGRVWFSKNGSWQAGGSPSTDTLPAYYALTIDEESPITYHPAASTYYVGEKFTGSFSAEAFIYEIPTGFSAYSISQTSEYVEVWQPGSVSGDSVVTLNPNDVLVIDADLGVRTHLNNLAYVFESSISGSLLASGIQFSYKDEGPFDYTDLVTLAGNNGLFYTSVSGALFTPRYLRLTHSLGTTSGLAYSFAAFSDDSVVGFGVADELKVQSFSTPRDNKANIKAIPIYNNGLIRADAEISLEPTYSELDDMISISVSEGGPWSYPQLGEIEIGSGGGDYDFDWGKYDSFGDGRKTVIDADGILQPEYYSHVTSGEIYHTLYSAAYVSKIIYGNIEQTRIIINRQVAPEYTGRLAVDRDDTITTVEVRRHNSPPTSYHVYTALIYTTNVYNGTTYSHFYIRRYDIRAGTYENLYNIDPNDLNTDGTDKNTYSNTVLVSYGIVTSYLYSYKNAGWMITKGSAASSYTRFVFFTYNGSTSYMYELQDHTVANSYLDVDVFHFKRRADGGVWAYFYAVFMHETDFINKTGHYLVAFNENMSNTFKGYNWTKSVGHMDVAEDSNYLWYTVPESNTIYKMNTAGTHELQYEYGGGYTDALGPIAVLPEEAGVWFVNGGTTLYKISAISQTDNENVLDIVELSIDSDVFLMSLDPDDYNYMWIFWGNTVGYLCLSGDRKGEVLFSSYITEVASLMPVKSGCWVRTVSFSNSSDDYIKFLSKADQKIVYNNSILYTGLPSPIERTYKDREYVSLFPEKTYNLWYGLEWQKVNLDTFLISEEKYYQFRLTFWPIEPGVNYPGETEYIIEDTFEQTSARPREVLWGDWQDKDVGNGLSRVYVNTVSGTLVLTSGGVNDPYIRTNRVLVGPEADGAFDVRYKYKYGSGLPIVNGVDSASNYIYLRLYPIDSDRRCSWFYFRQEMRYNTCYFSCDTDVDSSINTERNSYYAEAPNSWMRLYSYWYNGELHLGMSSYRNNAWYNYEYNQNVTLMPGNAMYVDIFQSAGNSRNLNIEEFKVVSGNIYIYDARPTEVGGIYLKTPVKLDNIAPYSYKNVYVKHQVPVDFSGAVTYEANLKARWEIPT